MAITLIGTPQVGSAISGAGVTLTFDVTPAENDYVIVYGGAGRFRAGGPTIPTGYTLIAKQEGVADSKLWFSVSYKKMTSSPDSNVVCNGSANAADATAYGCYVLRGVDTTTPQDATATTAGITVGTNPDCASITTVTNGAWVLALAGGRVYDTAPGTVSGYSNQYATAGTDTNSITVAGATTEKATAGAENPAAWDAWDSSDPWYAITVALRPAAAGGASVVPIIDSLFRSQRG